ALKRAAGRAVFLDLVRAADVVVDNFRPGVMERLNVGWDRLARLNPRLVHTSITGYGSSGPLAALPGFDPIFQARSGLTAAQGGDDAPVLHMIAYNDYCAGALGALATVAALVARVPTRSRGSPRLASLPPPHSGWPRSSPIPGSGRAGASARCRTRRSGGSRSSVPSSTSKRRPRLSGVPRRSSVATGRASSASSA